MKKYNPIRLWPYTKLVLGVTVCLVVAFLIGTGEPIFGEDHTVIATVVEIVGIGIITKAKKGSL